MSKKVLIIGAAGFIGSNLIKKLKLEHPSWKLVGVDNYFTGSADNHVDNIIYVDMNSWDINDSFFLNSYSPDIVFHFGEYSRIVKSFEDHDYVMKSNLYGTSEVIKFCTKHKSKLIYSASSSKFGNNGQDENLSPYSWAKSKGVELIKNYHNWFGLQYEICYFFNVYGPDQIVTGDYATVIGIFERQMKAGETLTVVSPGTQSRDFTHVEDVVSGVVKTLDMNLNREWMLRSGVNISIIDLAEKFTGDWKLVPERRGERFTSEEFYSDTEDVLNWNPEWTIDKWIDIIKK